MAVARRKEIAIVVAVFMTFFLWRGWQPSSYSSEDDSSSPFRTVPVSTSGRPPAGVEQPIPEPDMEFVWRRIQRNYPVNPTHHIPSAPTADLPKVQARFGWEGPMDKSTRLGRQGAIKKAFVKGWSAYREHAWMRDEVTPVTGKAKDTFGGWGATLIDSLDTLWIMGLADEFEAAVDAVDRLVSFETTAARTINVFETTIRFLGGLLSAYDLSGDMRLLVKARDAGDMLLKAFDTPNRMPITRWDLHAAAKGEKQKALESTNIAEIGSLSMEFSRLSLITGDPKYLDAVEGLSEQFAAEQMRTKVPGLWSVGVSGAQGKLDTNGEYSLGAMSDSLYEYLPKMVALMGQEGIYADMYTKSVEAIADNLLYRPMTPEEEDVLFAGVLRIGQSRSQSKTKPRAPTAKGSSSDRQLQTSATHLACFAGGMLALGGRLVSNDTHVDLGKRLASGCHWAYHNTSTTGVMPETMHLQACPSATSGADTGFAACAWDKSEWHQGIIHQMSVSDVSTVIEEELLQPGVTRVDDARYILRPEAIESVFVAWRVTGDDVWQERAWQMWEAIDELTATTLANSAVWNVNLREGDERSLTDSMESFWMGETLKYFYLIFSEPELVSLDEWVFNTEAHPFRRLRKDG